MADRASWHFHVVINQYRRGVILTEALASPGDDHSMSFYEGIFREFSSTHGSRAREGECTTGWAQKLHLAA
jgi:hypothetical protein